MGVVNNSVLQPDFMLTTRNDWHIHWSSLSGGQHTRRVPYCAQPAPPAFRPAMRQHRAPPHFPAGPAGAAYLPTMSTGPAAEVAMPEPGWPRGTEGRSSRLWLRTRGYARPHARRAMTHTYWLRSESLSPDWFRLAADWLGRGQGWRAPRPPAKGEAGRGPGRSLAHISPPPSPPPAPCVGAWAELSPQNPLEGMPVGSTGTRHTEFSNSLFIFSVFHPHPKVSVPDPFWNPGANRPKIKGIHHTSHDSSVCLHSTQFWEVPRSSHSRQLL